MQIKQIMMVLCAAGGLSAGAFQLDKSVMSAEYWKIWNDEALAKIDANIEKHRKADAAVTLAGVSEGTEVKVEQISHDFFFGAHIFNYNQLGTKERNLRYKELYGTLFNSATVAFYWRTLERTQGHVRFEETYWDSEEYWNNCKNPTEQNHWRRPPPDPVIAFCKQRGIRIHGHPLTWGDLRGQFPTWIWDDFCPEEEKFALERASGVSLPRGNWKMPLVQHDIEWIAKWRAGWREIFKKLSEEEVAKLIPTFFAKFKEFTENRVVQIAQRYGERVDSWDVINESGPDFPGQAIRNKPFDVSPNYYGVVPGDYSWRAFYVAQTHLPKKALLNINEYNINERYLRQIEELKRVGAKIDVVGTQMHLFDPKESVRIAAGKVPGYLTPGGVNARFDMLLKTKLPIHLSEITITAPDLTEKGQMIQAIILNNLYRAWFSQEKMMGITWWNVVDNAGAPGEPSISGLFTRDMKPKTAYYAMNDLINNQWKTRLTAKVADGKVAFRGFRGKYRLTWTDAAGAKQTKLIEVK